MCFFMDCIFLIFLLLQNGTIVEKGEILICHCKDKDRNVSSIVLASQLPASLLNSFLFNSSCAF